MTTGSGPWDGERDATGGRGWMMTFADLISLLLTFMVMLVAQSDIGPPSWPLLVDMPADSERLPYGAGARTAVRDVERSVPPGPGELDYIGAVAEALLAAVPRASDVRAVRRDDRLVLAIPLTELFDGTATTVAARSTPLLRALARVLARFPNRVAVLAHDAGTNRRPEDGAESGAESGSGDDWRAALERACAVAEALRAQGLDGATACHARIERAGRNGNGPPAVELVVLPEPD